MKIIKNEKLIARNQKIGQYTNIAGLLVIVGSIIFILQFTSNPQNITTTSTLVIWGVMFLGIALSQVSMYFGSRFGRRPDQAIDKALKGLPGEHTLYHYSTPVPHLLVGASGLWLLLPVYVRGTATYKNNRWRVSGGGFAQTYLRLFGQETIGRPDLEAESQIKALEKFLKKELGEGAILPTIQAAIVFMDEQVEINDEGSPMPATELKKLKELFRKAAKEHPLPAVDVERVKALLPKE